MSHDHSHSYTYSDTGKAFVAGIILNLGFVVVEAIAGFYTNSLALLSDAGHNLSDVATLALSLFAVRISRRKPSKTYTYGFHKSTILASLANAVILLVAVGGIGWEAIQRFLHPQPAAGFTISLVAGIGIVVNTASAFLFFRKKDHDLNVKGAYLHLVVDALVSVGVVVAGLIIAYTNLVWIDPLISLLIMGFIVYSTWGLLTESLKLAMDAVPATIDPDAVKRLLEKERGVREASHIHIWAMSTTRNALTAQLVLEPGLSAAAVTSLLKHLKHELAHANIHHATLETGSEDCRHCTEHLHTEAEHDLGRESE